MLHRDFLRIELGERCMFMPDFALQQIAASAAQIALTKALRKDTSDCMELAPFYLRPSQAEREFAKKEAAGKADSENRADTSGIIRSSEDSCSSESNGGCPSET